MKHIKKMLSLVVALAVIAAVMPLSGITAFAETGGGAISVILCDEEKIITVDENNNGNVMYFFTPEKDGTYAFYSYGNQFDLTGFLVDISANRHINNEYGGRDGNFYIQYEMKAGNTYILQSNPKRENNYGDYRIKVKELTAATDFDLSCPNDIVGYIGDQMELHAEFAPDNAIIETVEWDTDNAGVVTVKGVDDKTLNSHGLVRFLSEGTATVTATAESGKTVSINVTVKSTDTIACNEEKYLSTDTGTSSSLYSFVPDEDGIYSFYSYNNNCLDNYRFPVRGTIFDSKMEKIAEDDWGKDDNFNVQYNMKAGETYYLKAEPCNSDDEGSYNVKLVKTVKANSISLTANNNAQDFAGFMLNVFAEFAPTNAAIEKITWTSSNPQIVRIDNYRNAKCDLSLHSEGAVVITAVTESGLTASITITVNDLPEVTEDIENTVEITEPNGEKRFKFTPSESGYYTFTILGNEWVNFDIWDNNNRFLASDGRTFNYYLNADETYYLIARLPEGQTGTYTFTVSKTPEIKGLEISSYPYKMEYFEGETDFDFWGLKLIATFADGTTQECDYSVNDMLAGYRVEIENNFNGGKYVDTVISCGGKTVSFAFEIHENPVESIEVLSDGITLIDEAYGRFEQRYDSVSDSDVEFFYYYYDLPFDTQIRINYKDKTTKTVNIRDEVDGYWVQIRDNQHDKPWTLGGENYLTVSYLGVSAQLPVTIIENPVDHIEINTAPTREYFFGDNEFGYTDDDGVYHFMPEDIVGLSFTVYYTDNTSKLFTYEDADEFGNINGYYFELFYDMRNQPQLGDFPVTFKYMGKSDYYSVKLKESPVASITMTKDPLKTQYSDSYLPDFRGAEFTISFTDREPLVLTLNEENMYYFGNLSYKADIGENSLIIEENYSEDELFYTASFLGKSCDIRNIAFSQEKEVAEISLGNVSSEGDNMIVNITYGDETTQTLTMNVVERFLWDSNMEGFAMTENGILPYSIQTHFNEDGNLTGYTVSILGKDIYVEAPTRRFGDINGDGNVDVRDLVRLKKILAYITNDGRDFADLDKDGFIKSSDLVLLRKHLLGVIALYEN